MLISFWLMLGVCSLSVLGSCMSFCLCLFLCMAETMIWKEEEKSRIRVVQMDKIRSFLGIRIMDRVPNTRIREFCLVAKSVDK